MADMKDTCLVDTLAVPHDWTLSEREMCDLEMLLMGGFKPLCGFLTREEYFSVLNHMRLPTGEIWPIPITLPIPKSFFSPKNQPSTDKENKTPPMPAASPVVKLRDKVGAIAAELHVTDVYVPDIDLEMEKVIGSTDSNHPYNKILDTLRDCYYVGGKVIEVHLPPHFDFKEYRLSAHDVRAFIAQNQWSTVVGFQTRNPMHKSHFELTRYALNEVATDSAPANLLLTPVVGPTQPGDIDYHIRLRCYKKILPHYENRERVKLVVLPIAMRMAGPREAVWHAIIRRNYGCTHFIVGRDHAGPSTRQANGDAFYGPYDAHKLMTTVQDELGIKPIFGRNMVYVREGNGGYYQPEDQVPNGAVCCSISGSKVRELLENREAIPEWYSFPEVSTELQKYYRPRHMQGVCVYFTGLPCSGKSTLAVALEAALQESQEEVRGITILDADVIRTHLSQGLGFSRADRKLNVRRIGYVASEVVKHGGICLVANIAPYEEDREFNRRLIGGSGGGYVEVFVSTPLEICESRDIKELYRKARQGVIKQFTGISDPYETPKNPELVIDSSGHLEDKVAQVITYMRNAKWVL